MTATVPSAEHAAYVDEVIESASVLESLDEAAPAEAWASGAVAEWLGIGGVALGDAVAGRSSPAEAAIRWIEIGAAPTAAVADPAWLADLGTADPVSALRLCDPDQEREVVWIVEYVSASAARHDCSVTLRRGRLVDVAFGPAGLSSAAREGLDARVVVEPADPSAALDQIRIGLESSEPADLHERARLDLPLLCRRLSIDPGGLRHLFEPIERAAPDLTRDRDDDRYAAELIGSALGPPPNPERAESAVAEAAAAFAERVVAADPDARAVLTVGGLSLDDVARDPVGSLVRSAGAYLAPADLSPHPHDERDAIAALEPADWVGVLLGLIRQRDATPLTGDAAVAHINRCPEIATSIPASDAPSISWAFDRVLYAWECTGVLDDDGLLTDVGRWLLPLAVAQVWSGP